MKVNFRSALTTVFYLESSVGIARGYGLDGRGSVPGRGKISLSSTALGQTLLPIQWVPGEGKRKGREADHSPPSSAEVKNGGAIPPLPHMSSWRRAKLSTGTTFLYLKVKLSL
jgi:hypothetical protein